MPLLGFVRLQSSVGDAVTVPDTAAGSATAQLGCVALPKDCGITKTRPASSTRYSSWPWPATGVGTCVPVKLLVSPFACNSGVSAVWMPSDASTQAPDATADAAPAGPALKPEGPPTRVAPKAPAGIPAMAAKPGRPSVPAAVPAKSAMPAACLELETWRAGMRRELTALETYVAREDALADDFERHRAGFDYLRVTDAAGCARVEKRLDAFYDAHGLAR